MDNPKFRPDQAGWTIKDFCDAISISRTTLHALPPERKPAMVRINRRCLVMESPAAYLQRIAAAQSA